LKTTISIANRQKAMPIDRRLIRRTIRRILGDAGISEARTSVSGIDDSAVAHLHLTFLNDPDPTDVLSFVLERTPNALEGEVVVSADTALASAPRYRSTAEEELLRYVIHGTLHLVGHDDATASQRAGMRRLERRYLQQSDDRGVKRVSRPGRT
jgi:probable rRNA maturation factor